jgi:aminopeptidase N
MHLRLQVIRSIIAILCFGSFTLSYSQVVFPHDTRSDSIDIKHYDLHLDIRDFTTYILKGNADVSFKPLVNGISFIDLDLLGLTVDSVKNNVGDPLSYTMQGNGFRVNLGATYNTGDSTLISVYYHGHPVTDPSFGGFYWNATYAFSIGVSLDDIPHNYGKTWFPCFDNFTTRATFDLFVTTQPAHNAVCGGLYQSTVINPDLSETHHWKVYQTIPAYLASVGVGNYVFVKDGFTNILNDTVPVWLAARPTDTTNVKNSFINLEAAFDIYEDKWGLYRWDRVGYQMESMNSGAMEHAMNIGFPASAADGTLAWQSVMAHELSHHWWGDLVTCRTAEDMWINEGSAVYSEYLFTENFTNRAAYEAAVRNQHKNLVRICHIDDGGYWAVSGVPQAHTYGNTTYLKGADMIHTLRGYLGDSLFFSGLETLLEQNKFSDMDAIEYRDDLSAITGVNLNNYFADWIFQPGWPHISIDSMESVTAGPNYDVTVYLKQKLVARTNYSTQVPVTLTLRDNNWNTFEQTVYSSGSNNAVTISVPFLPTSGYLNRNELISHAVTGAYKVVTATGTVAMSHANITLQVQSVTDSAFIVAEQHWAAPDPVMDWTKGYTISTQRFWRIDGIWNAGFNTNASISYNGKTTGTNSHLDNLLINATEDSLILLYRPNRSTDWTEFSTYTKNMGNVMDKVGTISITNLQKGEYTLAMKGQSIGIEEQNSSKIKVYPNPTEGLLNIESPTAFDFLAITNMQGEIMVQKWVTGGTVQIDTDNWPKGAYILSGFTSNKRVFNKKVIVK